MREKRQRRSRVLVATHSPTLVNRLRPSEVVICDQDASSSASKLRSPQSKLLRAMQASDLGLGEVCCLVPSVGCPVRIAVFGEDPNDESNPEVGARAAAGTSPGDIKNNPHSALHDSQRLEEIASVRTWAGCLWRRCGLQVPLGGQFD
ncbi:MAG: hypothetical protein U0R80_00285 [Nocardioidaceae bacterium]